MQTLALNYITLFTTLLDSHLSRPGKIQPVGSYCAGNSCQGRAVTVWIAPVNRSLPRRGARVTPAKAGVQFHSLDSGFRRNDEFGLYGSDPTGVASGLFAFKKMRLPDCAAPEA